jgi:hypothetical protein
MDWEKVLINTGLIVCIIMTVSMTVLLLVYFFCGDTFPLQYYEADRALPSSNGDFGAPVYNLTEKDFTDHPLFNDLLIHRNKIVYSFKLGQVVLVARENFRSCFDGGRQFGWRFLSDGENAYLSQFDMHVVSYDGHYYYIRKEGKESIIPCGNHTQC